MRKRNKIWSILSAMIVKIDIKFLVGFFLTFDQLEFCSRGALGSSFLLKGQCSYACRHGDTEPFQERQNLPFPL